MKMLYMIFMLKKNNQEKSRNEGNNRTKQLYELHYWIKRNVCN